MSYTNAQARQRLLDALAQATNDIALAVANLTAAYEQVDDDAADRLEAQLFRPLQSAYGQAQRTYSEFAREHAMPVRSFGAGEAHVRDHDALGAIEAAATAIARADLELGTLQDSMLPVEVGDPPLRAGLEQVRVLLGAIRERARALERTLGR